MHGKHAIRHNSNTQNDLGLSSGEAEFSGVVKSASVGIGMKALGQDLNYERELVIGTDSSAALSMTKRSGLGKVRHIALRYLWVQQKLVNEEFAIMQTRSEKNLGDLETKHLGEKETKKFLSMLGYHLVTGRAANAPKLLRG